MSEYTREEILKLIEENGGPEGLYLSWKDLSGIDLGREAIASELKARGISDANDFPVWARAEDSELRGINLLRVSLQQAELARANLHGAFLDSADLRRARLQGANLQEAALGEANLQEVSLWQANLQEADLVIANLHKADLRHATIRKAQLHGANLLNANLGQADLQEADLSGADLRGAKLLGAKLQGARLRYCHLEKVDFFGSESLEGAYFYNAFLDDTRLKREQLGAAIGEELDGRYDEAKEAYLALKNNFAEIGRYKDAAWAYLKERRMEKLAALQKAREAWQKHDWKGAIRNYREVVGDQLVEWVCDYGEGLGRVAGSLIAVWVAFALIYGLIAGVWGPWQDTGSGKIRYITRNPNDLLSFSLRSITTFAPIEPQARPILLMRILMPLEALLSIFLAGLLGFVAGNRIRRS